MTAEERIEKLLNRTNNTISDLPKDLILEYPSDKVVLYMNKALEACEFDHDDGVTTLGYALTAPALYGLHLCDVIERLAWALENLADKYEKAKYRLNSWGDIHYVHELEEGKI